MLPRNPIINRDPGDETDHREPHVFSVFSDPLGHEIQLTCTCGRLERVSVKDAMFAPGGLDYYLGRFRGGCLEAA